MVKQLILGEMPNAADDIQGVGFQNTILRHPSWRHTLGSPQIMVPNVGYDTLADGSKRRRSVIIATDYLSAEDPFRSGMGLMDISQPQYRASEIILETMAARNAVILLPYDAHPHHSSQINMNAETDVHLTQDFMNQLLPRDVQRIKVFLQNKLDGTKPLTVAEWIEIFGALDTDTMQRESFDAEFRDFLFFQHCFSSNAKNPARMAPIMERLLRAAKQRNMDAIKTGDAAPVNRTIPLPKLNLAGNVAPDARGKGGNHYDSIMALLQAEMPQGGTAGEYARQRKIALMGAAIQYTVRLEVFHAMTHGYRVHLSMAAVSSIPSTISAFEIIRDLRINFPYAVTASFDWNEEFLGAKPTGALGAEYDKCAAEAKAMFLAEKNSGYGQYIPNEFGDASSPMKVIEDLA